MFETSYHNTNQLQGEALAKADAKAGSQEENAVKIFTSYWSQWFTRFAFMREYKKRHGVLLKDGSASRILSNLTNNSGVLEKSDNAMFPGEFENVPVYAWRLRMEGQEELF